jgi:hypothetical protein
MERLPHWAGLWGSDPAPGPEGASQAGLQAQVGAEPLGRHLEDKEAAVP